MKRAVKWLLWLPLVVACSRSVEDEERRVVATVNGTSIYLETFVRELKRLRLDDEDGMPSISSIQAQKKTLLDNLIDRRLLQGEAQKHNVVVGIDEVEAGYERTRAGWEPAEVDKLLEKKDITAAELKREIRELLMIQRYLRDQVYSRIAVTDHEITTYLEGHPELAVLPEEVHAQQIVVKSEEKAKQVAGELQRGTSFAEAAMKYSLSPEADKGGDLGFFARGTMPAVFDDVCFNLQPGKVSAVVRGTNGFHLFKVLERREIRPKPVGQARDQAEIRIRRDKEQEAHRQKVAELRSKAQLVIVQEEVDRVH